MQTIPKTLFAFIWHFIKQQKTLFFICQFCLLGFAFEQTLWPYLFSMFVDTISSYTGDKADSWGVLYKPVMLGLGFWFLLEITYRVSGFIVAYIIPKMEASIRMEMFDYVQRHSYTYFSNNFAGNLANKLSDMPQSISHILELVMRVFIPVFVAFVISAALFSFLQPIFGIVLFVWFTLHMSISFAFAGKCDEYSNIHSQARSTLVGKIVDSLTNNINVKLFSRYSYENAFISKYQQDEMVKHRKSLKYIESVRLLLGINTVLGAFVGLLGLMVYEWQQGRLTTGDVVFVFNTCWNITMLAWIAGLELPNLYREIGICRQALSIIQDPHDIVDAPQAPSLDVNRGEIVFDQVSFQYNKDNRLFENKSLKIKAGENIGLVGFSGSGKTTFVNLILRHFDINAGKILIDGQEISSVSQDSLHKQIAMIPQDAFLFHRTLMENIRYGKLDASDEEVIEASKKAHCHEFVMSMPEGYQTLVGERGVKLSGGQRQRIAIARAILKNAPILILDEATSALDSVTEKYIKESLSELIKGRTTIVIAHRLSTLLDVDRILVFKSGKIVEEGTHAGLLDNNGHYAMLWNMQAGGFLPDDVDES